eukprot:223977-Hanusia_phi.AAC.1
MCSMIPSGGTRSIRQQARVRQQVTHRRGCHVDRREQGEKRDHEACGELLRRVGVDVVNDAHHEEPEAARVKQRQQEEDFSYFLIMSMSSKYQ